MLGGTGRGKGSSTKDVIYHILYIILYYHLFLQGWFSPGQIYILDEYMARYGVRGCHKHLCYLSDLLDKAQDDLMIDPTLMHYSFAFCASHVYGNK